MQNQFLSLPPLPEWLKNTPVCPTLRGEEMWWSIGRRLMIRGFPPTGATFAHHHFHRYPENWGPIGERVQIERYTTGSVNGVYMRDQWGVMRCVLNQEYIDFLESMFPVAINYFYYPEIEEGKPQPVVAFATWEQGHLRISGVETERHLELFAFIAPMVDDPKYFLTIEQMTTLPLFSGIDVAEEEGDDDRGY